MEVAAIWGCSRDAGTLGQSEPQMHISKVKADPYSAKRCWVQGSAASHAGTILAWTAIWRRWGPESWAERGRKRRKSAIIATARKLAVLLHRSWVNGEVYEPLRQQQITGRWQCAACKSTKNIGQERK